MDSLKENISQLKNNISLLINGIDILFDKNYELQIITDQLRKNMPPEKLKDILEGYEKERKSVHSVLKMLKDSKTFEKKAHCIFHSYQYKWLYKINKKILGDFDSGILAPIGEEYVLVVLIQIKGCDENTKSITIKEQLLYAKTQCDKDEKWLTEACKKVGRCKWALVKLVAFPLLSQDTLNKAIEEQGNEKIRDIDTYIITKEHIQSPNLFDQLLKSLGIKYIEPNQFILENYRDMVAIYGSNLSSAPYRSLFEANKFVNEQIGKVLITMTLEQSELIVNPNLKRLLLSGVPGSGKSVTLIEKIKYLIEKDSNCTIIASSMAQFRTEHQTFHFPNYFDINFSTQCQKYENNIKCIMPDHFPDLNMYINELVSTMEECATAHLFIDEVQSCLVEKLERLVNLVDESSFIWLIPQHANRNDMKSFALNHKLEWTELLVPLRYTNSIHQFVSNVSAGMEDLHKKIMTANREGRIIGMPPLVYSLPSCPLSGLCSPDCLKALEQ